jgi:thioredoxin reductase (NADPH)
MVLREARLTENMSEYLANRIRAEPRVEVLLQTEVVALLGELVLRAVMLRHSQTGEEWTIETIWLFLCLGGLPHTQWAEEVGIVRDDAGYLVTGPDLLKNGQRPADWPLNRDPYDLETNVPGVFAAGDVRHGSVKRFASAVGEGAMAVTFAHRYLMSG